MPPKRKHVVKKQRGRGVMMISAHHMIGPSGGAYGPPIQNGEGFFGDLVEGIKSVGSKIGNFIKDNKVISTGLSLIPDPRFQIAGHVAGQLGLGKKRKSKNVLIMK